MKKTKEAEDIKIQFRESKQRNIFCAGYTSWPKGHHYLNIKASVFFRPAWRSRVPAYALVISQPFTAAAYVSLEKDLESVIALLYHYGYAGEDWVEIDESYHHHHIAPIDDEPLWNRGYGLVRQKETFDFAVISSVG